jgi:carbon storage regulator
MSRESAQAVSGESRIRRKPPASLNRVREGGFARQGCLGKRLAPPLIAAARCGKKAGRSLNMLVLSRQRDETIMIGDNIEVTVVDIRGDKVRLGINAPKEISVHRKEVYDAIRRENKAAAQVKPEDLSGFGKIDNKQDNEQKK